MTLGQVLRIFWARKWLMVAILIAAGAVGALVALNMPKQYTADASLVLDIKVDPILGAIAPNVASPAYMATQIEIIKSDPVATRVAKTLGLEKSPKAIEQWRQATGQKVSLDRYFGSLLQRGLTVEPLQGSNIITITFTAQDPVFAAAAANAFAQTYIDLSIEMRVEPARQYANWFDDQSKVLRANLERAQARLAQYQRDKGIVVSDEKLDQENARLLALNAQLAQAQAESVDAAGRQRNSGSELSPDVQLSGAVQGLKGELARAETKLSEMSAIVGVNHPSRQALVAQIAELRQQLAAEVRRVSGGASVASRSSSQKVAEIQALIDAQKKQLLGLRGEKDQIAVLVRDVETAQRAYENAGQRVSQLNLESQTNQANVRILSSAAEPLWPSTKRRFKVVLGALFGGVVVAIALALGLEHLDRRVRGPEDLSGFDGIPVLGVMRPPGSRLPPFRAKSLGMARPRPMLPPPTGAAS